MCVYLMCFSGQKCCLCIFFFMVLSLQAVKPKGIEATYVFGCQHLDLPPRELSVYVGKLVYAYWVGSS